MLAFDSICSVRQTSLFGGIHQRNFKQGMGKRLCLESHKDNVLWAFNGKVKRKDVLYIKVCNYAVKFWIDNTCVSPNMKDVVRRRLGPKSWESHPTHLLLESQVH